MGESPRLACPLCRASGVHLLETVSYRMDVDYFICRECFQVWNVPKGKDEPIQFVTARNKPFVMKPKSA